MSFYCLGITLQTLVLDDQKHAHTIWGSIVVRIPEAYHTGTVEDLLNVHKAIRYYGLDLHALIEVCSMLFLESIWQSQQQIRAIRGKFPFRCLRCLSPLTSIPCKEDQERAQVSWMRRFTNRNSCSTSHCLLVIPYAIVKFHFVPIILSSNSRF